MKLGRCPECKEIIDLDEIEELDGDEIIGCGHAENDLMFCDECPERCDSNECKALREENGWSLTKVKEYLW